MYNYDSNPCASSTSALSLPSPQDEISLFLRQFLLPSSSSASSPSLMTHMSKNAHGSMSSTSMAGLHPSYRPSLFQDGISAVDSTLGGSTSNDFFLSSSGIYSSANTKGNSAVNVSSSSLGVCENEYHCESEEGFEALAEEQPENPRRTSSKRGRAAEVHNLSEKRRRSRINEKMKALQNLIPNSNKTDKASMLDEAIEYLKQLQLQVQMLSMRNGLSLHHMCLAEDMQTLQLSQMGTELDEEDSYLPLNMTATLPLHQENPLPYVSTLPNERTSRDQPSVPSPSYVVKPETSFGQESPMIAHLRPFHLKRTSDIHRDDDILQHQQLNANHSDANPSGGSQVSLFFDMQASEQKDNSALETCIAGREQLGAILRHD